MWKTCIFLLKIPKKLWHCNCSLLCTSFKRAWCESRSKPKEKATTQKLHKNYTQWKEKILARESSWRVNAWFLEHFKIEKISICSSHNSKKGLLKLWEKRKYANMRNTHFSSYNSKKGMKLWEKLKCKITLACFALPSRGLGVEAEVKWCIHLCP